MDGHETPQSVSLWAEETFGPAGSNFSVACRANREMAELLSLMAADPEHPRMGEEMADVVIVLFRLAERNQLKPRRLLNPQMPNGNTAAVAMINDVMAELIQVLSIRDDAFVLEDELGWLFQHFHHLAHLNGIDLQAEIDRKMKTNRQRTWNLDGSGHGYHVKEPTSNA